MVTNDARLTGVADGDVFQDIHELEADLTGARLLHLVRLLPVTHVHQLCSQWWNLYNGQKTWGYQNMKILFSNLSTQYIGYIKLKKGLPCGQVVWQRIKNLVKILHFLVNNGFRASKHTLCYLYLNSSSIWYSWEVLQYP